MDVISNMSDYLVRFVPYLWWLVPGFALELEPMLQFVGGDRYEEWARRHISKAQRRKLAHSVIIFSFFLANYLAFQSVNSELKTIKINLEEAQKVITASSPAQQQVKINELEKSMSEIKGRRLTDEQKEKLISMLHPHANSRVLIAVSHNINDAEAAKYARDWIEVFGRSGWKTSDSTVVGSPFPNGISMEVKDQKIGDTIGAGYLQDAIKSVQGSAQAKAKPALEANIIGILIGASER